MEERTRGIHNGKGHILKLLMPFERYNPSKITDTLLVYFKAFTYQLVMIIHI